MKLFTIGFTQKSAERFFTLIRESGAAQLVDVRLNNSSQLAGFAKRDDLRFFLSEICRIDYSHEPRLAPTAGMLSEYRKKGLSWPEYEAEYIRLLAERRVESVLDKTALDRACLLCSEHEPLFCHRRLVAEYLDERWGGMEIVHLV